MKGTFSEKQEWHRSKYNVEEQSTFCVVNNDTSIDASIKESNKNYWSGLNMSNNLLEIV